MYAPAGWHVCEVRGVVEGVRVRVWVHMCVPSREKLPL
jgi:hypothetical protein